MISESRALHYSSLLSLRNGGNIGHWIPNQTMQLIPIFSFWFAVTTLILLTLTIRDTWAEHCAAGKWGATCEGVCHCALKSSVCDESDGRCLQGGCSRGYTGHPTCQTPCSPGTFGLDCSMTCHCPEGDVCDHVNGLCSSNHCLAGYQGGSCQIRFPVFSRPPNVTDVSRDRIRVTWRPWSPAVDLGDPPVAEYHLQYRRDGAQWLTYDVINITSGAQEPTSYSRTVTGVVPLRSYEFRLALARSDDGKVSVPFPGPSTGLVKACSAPTQEPIRVTVFQEIQQNNLVHITLRWTAPDASTSGCTSIESHQVTLQCDNGACATLVASVAMPSVTFTFSDGPSDVDKEVKVSAVNDAGQVGPPDTLFLMALTSPTPTPSPLTTSVPLKGATTWAATPGAANPGGNNIATGAVTTGLQCLRATETSLELTWPSGQAPKYEVVMRISDSYRVPDLSGQIQQKVTLSGSYIRVHSLHASTLYTVTVTPDPSGTTYQNAIWTHPLQPPAPPNPAVLRVTNQTAVLFIKPLLINTGPLTGYHIVVEQLSQPLLLKDGSLRRKRNTENKFENLKSYDAAKVDGLNYYLTAELTGSTLTAGINFTIGDNRTYNGYRNVLLKQNTKYIIWIGILSTLAGVTKRTFVNVESSARDGSTFTTLPTNPPLDIGATVFEGSSKTGMVVGLFFLFLILIILGIFIYLFRQRGWSFDCPSSFVECWENNRDLSRRYFLRTQRRASNLFTSVDKIDLNTTGPEIHVPTNDDDYYILKKNSSMSVDDFVKYHESRQKASLDEEFRTLPRGMTATAYVAKSVQNLHLNRNNQTIPYDVNRLCMVTRTKGENDYINATLLKGLHDKSYIVTQAPLPVTIPHFWRVVWDYRISRIVMLLNLHEEHGDRFPRYWSPEGQSQRHGPLRVKLVKEENYAFYAVRSFELTLQSKNEVRYVRHFQYTDWQKPNGVPGCVIPFLDFIQRCQRNVEPSELCVVHCQSGAGRSGLFLAIEILLQQARMTGQVDIAKCVTLLRLERVGLVKTLSQYLFIHEALFHALSYKDSVVNAKTFHTYLDNLIYVAQGKKTLMQREFESMLKMSPTSTDGQDRFMSPAKSSLPMSKDTFSRPGLSVTLLDSHQQKGYYLILDHPTETKIGTFWKNIQDFDCSCVVRLSDPDDSLYPFLPDCGENCIYGDMDVTHAHETYHSEYLLERSITISRADIDCTDPPTDIALFHLCWPDEKAVPNVRATLDLCRRVELTTEVNPGRVAVVSGPGTNRSGLFCVSAVLLDKMDMGGEVDIYQSVKHFRTQMPQAVTILEQYRFCYRLIKEYLRQAGKAAETSQDFNTSLPHRPFKSPFKTSTPKNIILVKEAPKDETASPHTPKGRSTTRGNAKGKSPSGSAAGSRRPRSAGSLDDYYVEGSGEGTSSGIENLEEDTEDVTASGSREKVQQVGEIGDLHNHPGAFGGAPVEEKEWQGVLREAARLRQQKTPTEMEGFEPSRSRAQRESMLYEDVESLPSRTRTLPPQSTQYKVAQPKALHMTVDDSTYSVGKDKSGAHGRASPRGSPKTSRTRRLSPSEKRRARLEQIGKALPHIGGKRW